MNLNQQFKRCERLLMAFFVVRRKRAHTVANQRLLRFPDSQATGKLQLRSQGIQSNLIPET